MTTKLSLQSLPRALFFICLAVAAGLAGAPALMASTETGVPGRLVDVGGYRLHIFCQGEGSPALIFDSGTGGFSLEWVRVQKALARRTRVCSYDRAGYGWSDMGPLPRTSERITRELHTLLDKADEVGPYILVGHSFGGYNAQLFARNYPEQTAGLVLIDSSHPQQAERLPSPEPGIPRRALPRSRSYLVSRHFLHPNFPDEKALTAQRFMQTWNHQFTWREEMTVFPISARQVLAASRPMPEVPVVVLTRGRRIWPYNDYGDEMERVWMELQDELSRLGDNNPVQTMLDANFADE